MPQMHESRPAGNRAAINATGEVTTSITESADNHQHDADVFTALATGRIELHSLSRELFEVYCLAWQNGRDSLRTEVLQLRADRDRMYRLAFPEKARQQDRAWVQQMARAIEYGGAS